MDDFDKRWERIHEQLLSQLHGDEPPRIASRRTLFGIQSGVEAQMERFAEQIERERAARVRAKRGQEGHMARADDITLDVADVIELEGRIAANGTTLYELMQSAGAALARFVQQRESEPCGVTVLAGSGNNGGDGWVAAELLARAGYDVTLASVKPLEALAAQPARTAAEHVLAAGLGNLRILHAPDAGRLDEALAGAHVALDALLGTGFAHEDVREPLASWIRALNVARETDGLFVLATDVASGVNAQTGACAEPHVRADATVTMLVRKPGLALEPGASACGAVSVACLCDLTPHESFLQQRRR